MTQEPGASKIMILAIQGKLQSVPSKHQYLWFIHEYSESINQQIETWTGNNTSGLLYLSY